jgi:hypothetical protein
MLENERVRNEIKIFRKALASYPEHFAANPQITFEEHCASLIANGNIAPQAPVHRVV